METKDRLILALIVIMGVVEFITEFYHASNFFLLLALLYALLIINSKIK